MVKDTRTEVERLREENRSLTKENADLKQKLETLELIEAAAATVPPPLENTNSIGSTSKTKAKSARRRLSSSIHKVVAKRPSSKKSGEHDKSSLLNVGGGLVDDDDDEDTTTHPHIGNVMDLLRQDYEQRLSEVTRERDELKSQLSTYKSQCSTLQTKVDKVEGEVGLVKFDLDAARLELVQKEDDVAHLVHGMQKDMSKALAKKDGVYEDLVHNVQLSVQDAYEELLRDAAFLDQLPEAYLVPEEENFGSGGRIHKEHKPRDGRDRDADEHLRRRSNTKGTGSMRKRGASSRKSSKAHHSHSHGQSR